MVDQPLTELLVNDDPPQVIVKNLKEAGLKGQCGKRGLPLTRLKKLVAAGGDWSNEKGIRLLAWSEEHDSWFCWLVEDDQD